jgi:hypothetical protein
VTACREVIVSTRSPVVTVTTRAPVVEVKTSGGRGPKGDPGDSAEFIDGGGP